MTRDERHRWLFAKMDGRRIYFTQAGMPFRVLRKGARFGGVVTIGDTKCRIRIIRREEEDKGKKNEVHFPDFEWKQLEDGSWSSSVTDDDSTLVGFMEICGNWKAGDGKCIFHSVGEN